jgi:hypothetical protein
MPGKINLRPTLSNLDIAPRYNFVSVVVLLSITLFGVVLSLLTKKIELGIIPFLFGVIFSLSPQIVQEWEKGVVLRFGKFEAII